MEARYNLALILEENEPASAIFPLSEVSRKCLGGRYPVLEGDMVQHERPA